MTRVVASFDLRDDSTKISQTIPQKLMLDPQKQHYLSLIQVNYSNIFVNVKNTLTTNFSLRFGGELKNVNINFPPGIYEIEYILKKINEEMEISSFMNLLGDDPLGVGKVCEFKIDGTIGRVVIEPNMFLFNTYSGTIQFYNTVSSSVFNSPLLGLIFDENIIWDHSFIEPPKRIIGTQQPSVSTYNKLSLSTNLISFKSYITEGQYIVQKSQLYSLPASASAFEFVTFTASIPLLYSISPGTYSLDRIEFILTDDSGNELDTVSGAKTDFGVYVQILSE